MLFSTLNTHVEINNTDESEPSESSEVIEQNRTYPQPLLFVLEKLLSIFKSLENNWDVTEQITEVGIIIKLVLIIVNIFKISCYMCI